MSFIERGKWISCDGTGCNGRARAVVALRPVHHEGNEAHLPTKGWLFVIQNGTALHFCPDCAPSYLRSLSSSEPISSNRAFAPGNFLHLAQEFNPACTVKC